MQTVDPKVREGETIPMFLGASLPRSLEKRPILEWATGKRGRFEGISILETFKEEKEGKRRETSGWCWAAEIRLRRVTKAREIIVTEESFFEGFKRDGAKGKKN